MEKLLPQNIEAECGVLGSLLIDPEALDRVIGFLRPDDFYRDAHRTIYEAILALSTRSEPADFLTLCDELARQNKLEAVGGASYITSLINLVPTSGNAAYYARIVLRSGVLRRLIAAAGKIAALGYEEPDDTQGALEQAERLIFEVSQPYLLSSSSDIGMSELMAEYQTILEDRYASRGRIVGVPTGYRDLDRLLGGLQRSDLAVLAARTSIGKCLTAYTLIDDPTTGARLTIEECVQRRLPLVYGISKEGKIRSTAVTDWVDSGVQPCYRVSTRLGRMVETTGHHPFLTVNGWVPLRDLAVGSFIAVPTSVPVFGNDETWPLDLVRLLAYFIAEGGLTDNSPEFTNTDPILVDDFKKIIATLFPACATRQQSITYIVAQPRNADTMRRGAILPKNPVTVWLEEQGLWGKLARDKHFPACVWTWSRRYLAEFLRVLMSCDGSIYASDGLPRIEMAVASPQLARDVQHALLRFGIVAKYYRTSQGAWRAEITSRKDVQNYQENIGWMGEKASRFVDFVYRPTAHPRNNGHVPKEVWPMIRAAAQQQNLSLTGLAQKAGETTKQGKYAGYNPQTGRAITRRRLTSYAEVLDHPQLRFFASPDIYWDEIVSIEFIGEHQVYDLTVPDGSNFIAQDIVVHNTAFAVNVAYNAAIRFKCNVGIFSLEMSKEQLAGRFLALDSNVEQQRLRTGYLLDGDWDPIVAALGRLSELGIRIDDTSGISLVQMRSRARRWIADYGIQLLIVDYLQLVAPGDNRKYENRQQEVSVISRGLKNLARELNVPVLALSQLSRALETRQSKVPQLSDLRESGSIENDADVVLFIYRDEVYNAATERKNQADLIVAKQRNGPIGQAILYFDQAQSRFANLETAYDPESGEIVFAEEDAPEEERRRGWSEEDEELGDE
jgi:replicative DNA helicase